MSVEKLLVIDGNSIINRAFYGIMGNKMLMTADGTYTNAVYGFLAIMFKALEDIKPEYLAIAFDLKAPTKRHLLYKEYKGTRKGMPDELAQQMPILKNVLRAMNITIIEKEGYEADDILGTLSNMAAKENINAIILSGDRDTFQLINKKINVRIPHTKAGKTETEDYTVEKIAEIYGLEPKELIEVKGLMGDASDNIPGVPGVGEKTAIKLIKEYKNIDELYNKIETKQDDLRGALREKIEQNKDLAILSRTLGTIDTNVPLDMAIEDIKIKEWDNEKVLEIFTELKFNRYIERFELGNNKKQEKLEEINSELLKLTDISRIEKILEEINKTKKIYYLLEKENSNNKELIINKTIKAISVYIPSENKVYYILVNNNMEMFKNIFEDFTIEKYGYDLKEDIILLKQIGINANSMKFDIKIAGYILNSVTNQYEIKNLAETYLNLNLDDFSGEDTQKQKQQISLFEETEKEKINELETAKSFMLYKLKNALEEQLKQTNALELFNNIEMPLVPVLASMEYEGVYVDKQELIEFGKKLQEKIEELTNEIYKLAGQEFNINSTKQLGEVLFEKLGLPVYKKTKTGYSTDVDILEKLRPEHPVIEKILEYRQITKMNSTYVEGVIPFINPRTQRIHSHFHQTVTATGRISSSDPNLQNIPTRMELGKQLRKVFKVQNENQVLVDADYSQIELRVFAHMSEDTEMINAFNNGEDIHKQAASKVFGIPLEEVTSEQRSKAKAVNFGIVYGISDFGLAAQIGVSKKEAKQYIEQYLEKYSGIKKYMDETPEKVKQKGYVETIYKRRRYVPEITSKNYMVRQFGIRAAMNMPIQGTAADIIKIAMINVYNELKKQNLKSKLILQVHDELLIETYKEEQEVVKNILKNCMENVIKLSVPLKVDINEGINWYEAK
ncbi:MAG: DNA polymerase I [Clostridia bacterium]|nr:DNA polymerase I [Clostridia bacterium]